MSRNLTVLAILCVPVAVFADPGNVICRGGALDKECRQAGDDPSQLNKGRKAITLKGVTLKRELHAPGQATLTDRHCSADFDVSYMQRDQQIQIDTVVRNEDCAESGGSYALRIRTYTITAQGEEPITRTIEETWQRTTSEPFRISKKYAMEGATYVGWVRVKTDIGSACLCAEPKS